LKVIDAIIYLLFAASMSTYNIKCDVNRRLRMIAVCKPMQTRNVNVSI